MLLCVKSSIALSGFTWSHWLHLHHGTLVSSTDLSILYGSSGWFDFVFLRQVTPKLLYEFSVENMLLWWQGDSLSRNHIIVHHNHECYWPPVHVSPLSPIVPIVRWVSNNHDYVMPVACIKSYMELIVENLSSIHLDDCCVLEAGVKSYSYYPTAYCRPFN